MRELTSFEVRLRNELITAISQHTRVSTTKRVAIASASLVIVAAAVTIGVVSLLQPHQQVLTHVVGLGPETPGASASAPHGILLPSMASGEPYPDAYTAGLPEAERYVAFPLVRPHSVLANDQTVARVWLSRANGAEAAIDYESGIRVYLSQVTFDPATFFEEQQKEGVPGQIMQINGHLAFVIPAIDEGSPSTVEVVVNGVDVVIFPRDGDHAMSELLDVAATLS